jgi:para-aminobenzoate synthetase component 1
LHCRLPDRVRTKLAPWIGSWTEPALLEGGEAFGDAGRWSIYTARPRLVFEAVGGLWAVRTKDGREEGRGDVLGALQRLLARFDLADPTRPGDPALPPFTGGLIGFFGYDLAPRLERLPRRAPRASRMPDIRFALFDTAVTVDHTSGAVDLWAHDFLGEGSAAVEHRLRRWKRGLETNEPPPRPPRSVLGPLASNFTKDEYIRAVKQALEYIAAGDVFQINLSQRFCARGRPEPLDLYVRLRERSPAPFAAYLRWDDLAIVSASPEWFYQTRGEQIVTRPIKGTRPRGRDREEDAHLAAELANSAKDRAELTMIVDLERNDLGRVCQYGTVRVLDALTVESFAQVHHLVATVDGRIRPGIAAIDVVKAVFPGGSITGAPKIRAMEIIDELEPNRRSVYTGAIGYFGRSGTSGFNIAIRTMLVEGDEVSYQVGGGIVADSDPETEFLETLHKGRGLRSVLEDPEKTP